MPLCYIVWGKIKSCFRLTSPMVYIPHLPMLQEGFIYLDVSFKDKNENCDTTV